MRKWCCPRRRNSYGCLDLWHAISVRKRWLLAERWRLVATRLPRARCWHVVTKWYLRDCKYPCLRMISFVAYWFFTDLCSHKRSWMYWAESVIHQDSFPAVRCESWKEFQRGANGNIASMGFDCAPEYVNCMLDWLTKSLLILSFLNSAIDGNYYLQTNSRPLYSRGHEGIRYSD